MKEEIIGGLHNALDRGETIETAMQTFINAGYSANEVREAASMVAPSATGMLSSTPAKSLSQAPQKSSPEKTPQAVKIASATSQSTIQQTPASPMGNSPPQTVSAAKGKSTAIILAVILLLLAILLGVTILYSDKILGMFSS